MPLIDHLSLGISDVDDARAFYDGIMSCLGYKCLSSSERAATYGENRVEFLLLKPFDGGAPSGGNGTHIGFSAATREIVDRCYDLALKAGGTDEGAPGVRERYPMPDVYTAYVRDIYGNKLEFIHNGFSVER